MYELIWVKGPDSVSFLQGLVSQDVEAMGEGQVSRSFLLGPKGKLVALLWLLRGHEEVGILCDWGIGERVIAGLQRYQIRVKVEFSIDERPISVLLGEEAAGWIEPRHWIDEGKLRASIPLGPVSRVLVAGEEGGAPDITALRVENGEPVMGRDVDEGTIPQETGLVAEAVSFTKGCYLGQELVARIHSRGHVNRRLVGLVMSGGVLPSEGAALWAGDSEVGRLSSPVVSERLGHPVALALIRREVNSGDVVQVRWDRAETTAVVSDLPML